MSLFSGGIDYRKQHRTTTTIDADDWKFMKEKNIRVAHAVRAFVAERRATDSGQYKESITTLRAQRDKQAALRENLLKAMGDILTDAQFKELMQKI